LGAKTTTDAPDRYDFDFRSDKSKYSGNEKWVRDP
jgi:hypothetical protein